MLFIGVIAGQSCKTPKKVAMPSLIETFGKKDTKPFGGFVAFNRFKQLLDNRFIETNEDPFDEAWKTMKDYSTKPKYSLYILLTRNLITSEDEATALVDYVEAGNDMIIAADYIDNNLLTKITCTTERDTELISELAGTMGPSFVKLKYGNEKAGAAFSYYYYPFLNSFSGYDSDYTKVLGVNQAGKPNLLVHFIGKGRLYLSAAPRAFSNYFLLKDNNYQYLENVFSFMRPDPRNIYWDEYYKKQDIRRKRFSGKQGSGRGRGSGTDNENNNFSSFNVINKSPALRTAFWLALLLLLLYVLFNIKRKQRIINEVKPNINTTLVFAETVGRLYLQKKNNKNIAEKMITYFYEHIRNRYFLNTTKINNEFITSLSRKSGVVFEVTERLVNSIQLIQQQLEVDDLTLLSLNEQIQNFYKNKN